MKKYFFILFVIFLFGCEKETKVVELNEGQLKILSYFPENIEMLVYASNSVLNEKSHNIQKIINVFNSNKYYNFLNDNFSQDDWIDIYFGISSKSKNELFLINFNNGNFFQDLISNRNLNKISEDLFQDKSTQIFIKNEENILLLFENEKIFKSKKNISSNVEFINAVNLIENKNELWGILKKGKLSKLTFNKKFAATDFNGNVPYKNELKFVTFSITIDDNINLSSNLIFETEQTASKVAAGIKLGVAFNLFSKGNIEIDKLTKKLKLKRNSEIINLNIKLNQNDIDVIKNSPLKAIIL